MTNSIPPCMKSVESADFGSDVFPRRYDQSGNHGGYERDHIGEDLLKKTKGEKSDRSNYDLEVNNFGFNMEDSWVYNDGK